MGGASGGCRERGETGAGAAAAVATGKRRRGGRQGDDVKREGKN